MKLLALLLSLCTSLSVLADSPPPRAELKADDYAWHWPLVTPINSSAFLLRLTPEVYRSLAMDHLEDLAVFNAAGQRLPLGSLPEWMMPPEQLLQEHAEFSVKYFPPLAPPVEISPNDEAKIPTISVEVKNGNSATTVHIENDKDNHSDVVRPPPMPTDEELAERGPPLRLNENGRARLLYPDLAATITVDGGAGATMEEFQINWESDLAPRGYWRLSAIDSTGRRIAAQSSILNSGNAIEDIVKLRAPGIESRTFLLEAFNVPVSFKIHAITPYTRNRTQFASQEWINADSVTTSTAAGEFVYRLPGPLTVQRAQIELDTPGTLTQLALYRRGHYPEPWRFAATDEVYQLQFGNQWLESGLLSLPSERAGELRVTSNPALLSAPKLKIAYRPDYLVFLAQGTGPYILAAGNARAFVHADATLIDQVLRKTYAQFGSQWLPPWASLSQREAAAGDAALTPQAPPRDWKSWLLWGLLILGAGAVIAMAVSLMRGGESHTSDI